MGKTALFPGSFDPLTLGHEWVARRAASVFDKIIVAVGDNDAKRSLFGVDERVAMIRAALSDISNIEITSYSGLTVNFCHECGARFIVRGLRCETDFAFESNIAQVNRALSPDIETVFLLAPSDITAVSSSAVREIVRHGGHIDKFVSPVVAAALRERFTGGDK